MTLDPSAFGAELTIDISAIAANWLTMKARAGSAECGAVIKADAYGCGIEQVAPALWEAGCRSFFVAHLSEAARARAALPEATIYVLNGLLPGFAAPCEDLRVTPVLGSEAEIDEWSSRGGGPCAIHVDTGMNRLGLSMQGFQRAASQGLAERVDVRLLMTHFSASEMPEDMANARQITRFAAACDAMPGVRASLLNSSGHFIETAPRLALTRPGYGLYGGNPTPGAANPMQPVVSLRARIIQVREVQDGDGVGYNSRWHAKGRRKLATICLGYADGYPRNGGGTDISAGGQALVGGTLCPFAGTVSMDLIIIDVTDAPESAAQRGEWVTLIGDGLDIDAVGAGARTIGYEMLTNLGRRSVRRHVR